MRQKEIRLAPRSTTICSTESTRELYQILINDINNLLSLRVQPHRGRSRRRRRRRRPVERTYSLVWPSVLSAHVRSKVRARTCVTRIRRRADKTTLPQTNERRYSAILANPPRRILLPRTSIFTRTNTTRDRYVCSLSQPGSEVISEMAYSIGSKDEPP